MANDCLHPSSHLYCIHFSPSCLSHLSVTLFSLLLQPTWLTQLSSLLPLTSPAKWLLGPALRFSLSPLMPSYNLPLSFSISIPNQSLLPVPLTTYQLCSHHLNLFPSPFLSPSPFSVPLPLSLFPLRAPQQSYPPLDFRLFALCQQLLSYSQVGGVCVCVCAPCCS